MVAMPSCDHAQSSHSNCHGEHVVDHMNPPDQCHHPHLHLRSPPHPLLHPRRWRSRGGYGAHSYYDVPPIVGVLPYRSSHASSPRVAFHIYPHHCYSIDTSVACNATKGPWLAIGKLAAMATTTTVVAAASSARRQ